MARARLVENQIRRRTRTDRRKERNSYTRRKGSEMCVAADVEFCLGIGNGRRVSVIKRLDGEET
jgi:hypothetical protein